MFSNLSKHTHILHTSQSFNFIYLTENPFIMSIRTIWVKNSRCQTVRNYISMFIWIGITSNNASNKSYGHFWNPYFTSCVNLHVKSFLTKLLSSIWASRKTKVYNWLIWSTRIKLAQQKLQFPPKIWKPPNLQLKFHCRKCLKTLMCSV